MTAHVIVNQGRVGDRAPFMIRGARLTGDEIARRHGLESSTVGTPSPAVADDWTESLPAAESTLTELAAAVDETLGDGRTPIVLSSTCSASLATLPVVLRHRPDTVVLYIDGHGDFNTPDGTTTGYLGGMVLSGACGLWESGHGDGVDPRRSVLVGSRDIDDDERRLIAQHGVRLLPPSEVTPETVLALVGSSPVWVHVDWDVLEPGYVPADYVVPDGLTPTQMRSLFEAIPAEQLVGAEFAEFNAPEDESTSAEALEVLMTIVEPVVVSAAS